ncbi:hypothetical protein A1D15_1846 [Lactiplantibacillus plantarum]|nr:hypothetical protein A1D15_1846 [Lactiplantibacillus plantarum]
MVQRLTHPNGIRHQKERSQKELLKSLISTVLSNTVSI